MSVAAAPVAAGGAQHRRAGGVAIAFAPRPSRKPGDAAASPAGTGPAATVARKPAAPWGPA
jgi:hypothetical protein